MCLDVYLFVLVLLDIQCAHLINGKWLKFSVLENSLILLILLWYHFKYCFLSIFKIISYKTNNVGTSQAMLSPNYSFMCLFWISLSPYSAFFFFLWLYWVFVSVQGLSLVVASKGHSSSRCAGLSLSRPLLLRSTGSRRAGSVTAAHGTSCSAACGIFPDQGSNPCALHWQADSQPLHHQGSPCSPIFILKKNFKTTEQLQE